MKTPDPERDTIEYGKYLATGPSSEVGNKVERIRAYIDKLVLASQIAGRLYGSNRRFASMASSDKRMQEFLK